MTFYLFCSHLSSLTLQDFWVNNIQTSYSLSYSWEINTMDTMVISLYYSLGFVTFLVPLTDQNLPIKINDGSTFWCLWCLLITIELSGTPAVSLLEVGKFSWSCTIKSRCTYVNFLCNRVLFNFNLCMYPDCWYFYSMHPIYSQSTCRCHACVHVHASHKPYALILNLSRRLCSYWKMDDPGILFFRLMWGFLAIFIFSDYCGNC